MCDILGKYRDFWRGVLFVRPGAPTYNQPGRLGAAAPAIRSIVLTTWDATPVSRRDPEKP